MTLDQVYVEAVFCGHNHTNAYFENRTQYNINWGANSTTTEKKDAYYIYNTFYIQTRSSTDRW
ncbi:MAG: hypothetical protein QXD64_07085 [Thermoplasmata archaeon]